MLQIYGEILHLQNGAWSSLLFNREWVGAVGVPSFLPIYSSFLNLFTTCSQVKGFDIEFLENPCCFLS